MIFFFSSAEGKQKGRRVKKRAGSWFSVRVQEFTLITKFYHISGEDIEGKPQMIKMVSAEGWGLITCLWGLLSGCQARTRGAEVVIPQKYTDDCCSVQNCQTTYGMYWNLLPFKMRIFTAVKSISKADIYRIQL